MQTHADLGLFRSFFIVSSFHHSIICVHNVHSFLIAAMPLPLSQLLQVSDSAFPTGAFAYSSGLEALARAGRFVSMKTLEEYLGAHLQQAGAYDLAFVAAAHAHGSRAAAAGTPESSALEMLGALCAEWDATLWNHGMRAASLRQARALLDALGETFSHPGVERLRARAAAGTAQGGAAENLHFAPVLGYALALLGASREQACCLYLHGIVRDQAAAAVRLGLVGPRAGQALQARAMHAAAARLGDGSSLPAPRDARRNAPLVETGQGGHGFLYSRLFQN
jgi:urease accessory protein